MEPYFKRSQAARRQMPADEDYNAQIGLVAEQRLELSDVDWEQFNGLFEAAGIDQKVWLRRMLGLIMYNKLHPILASIEAGIGLPNQTDVVISSEPK